MPNGGVTRKTFEDTPTDGKLNILFDQQAHMIQAMRDMKILDIDQQTQYNKQCAQRYKECDNRFKVIELGWAKLVGGVLLMAVVMPVISTMVIHALWK